MQAVLRCSLGDGRELGDKPVDFKLDDHGLFQTAKTRLASWAGYLDRSGPYGGPGPAERSDGTVEIVFAPEGRDTSPLTDHEQALEQRVFNLQHTPLL